MPSAIAGYLDTQGRARLKFHIHGTAHDPPGVECDGIIDTGFTGFLQLPFQHGVSLKLALHGTSLQTLADGSTAPTLTTLGYVTLNNVSKSGVILLDLGLQEVLIGMAFLRQFQLSLLVTKNHVALLPEDWLEKAYANYQRDMGGSDATNS